MFAGIMDGMHKQRAANTTNRRESSRLFNEHLKNAQEMGVEMNTEDLTNAWYQNSGGVLARHAPSQSRLQGIVDAQNKSLAEKQAVTDFASLKQAREVDQFVLTDINKRLSSNAMLGDSQASISDLNDSFTEQFKDNPLLMQAYLNQTGEGGNRLGEMQTTLSSEAQAPQMQKVMELIATGSYDAETLKRVYSNVDPAFIDDAVTKATAARDQENKANNQADIIFNEGRVLHNNKLITFTAEQDAAVLAAARLIVDNKYKDRINTITIAQKEAEIESAKALVLRKVVTEKREDIKFVQGQMVAAFDFSTAVRAAAQLEITNDASNKQATYDAGQQTIEDGNQNAISANKVATMPARNAANANVIIERQVEVDEATFESVKAAYNSYNITDEAVIKNAWDLTNARQSRSIMTGMTTTNLSNASKLASSEADIAELIAKEMTTNSKNFGDHVSAITDNSDIASAANLLSQKYEMKGNFITAFQDEISAKIDTGDWEDATQTQILISMTEMAQGLFPTYESKRASLVAAAKIKIGPDQYTPLAFKERYMVDVQEEINAHLATMNQAITNQDRNSFLVGQGSMAALAVEIIADLKVRGKIPQKAFGPAVTTEEISEAISGMTDIITQGNLAASGMEAPAEKEDVVKESRAFDANLYKPQLYASGPITSIEGALSIINGKIQKATDDTIKYQFNPMLERLEAAQLQFPVLVKQYDDLNKVYKGIKGDQSKLNEELQVKEQMDEIAKNITKLQQGVARIVNNLQP